MAQLAKFIFILATVALSTGLGSCSVHRPTYRGFHGPAYLPSTAKPWPANRKI